MILDSSISANRDSRACSTFCSYSFTSDRSAGQPRETCSNGEVVSTLGTSGWNESSGLPARTFTFTFTFKGATAFADISRSSTGRSSSSRLSLVKELTNTIANSNAPEKHTLFHVSKFPTGRPMPSPGRAQRRPGFRLAALTSTKGAA